MQDWLPRHRITVDEFHRMVETGVIDPDARVELIEGEIIDMPPVGSLHGSIVDQLNELLWAAVGKSATVRVQGAVRLSANSELLPDIALLKRREDHYRASNPEGYDTLLIVEVSDTTLKKDRQTKIPLYARHGVREVWIFDLEHQQVHFFRSLKDDKYTDVSSTSKPGVVTIPDLPGATVDLSGILQP